MAEEPRQSESPLYSDFERLASLLNDAQNISRQNRNYNPAVLREYFIVLAEIQRFLYPMFGNSEKMVSLNEDVEDLDEITKTAYKKLLSEKDYKVPSKIFDSLSELHTDLLILKQDAGLGIKVREYLTSKKKLKTALD